MFGINTDHEKVSQILFNLLNSAVKFTNKGCITVGAERLDENDDSVVIKVKDNGIGMTTTEKAALNQLLSQNYQN